MFDNALEVAGTLFGLLLFLGPVVLIVQKAGYSGWWVLLGLVPFVNYLALLCLALAEWPIETEVRRLASSRPKSAAEARAEATWERERLVKRVATLDQLADAEASAAAARHLLEATGQSPAEHGQQTIALLEQSLERAPDSVDRAVIETLLSKARECESRLGG